MGIRLKLILPIVVLWLGVFAAVNYRWIPTLVESEKQFYKKEQHEKLELLVTGIAESILQGDLGNIYATFENVLEKNSDWIGVVVRDKDQNLLYPLEDAIENISTSHIGFDHKSYYRDKLIANVHLVADPSKAYLKVDELVAQIRWVIFLLFVTAISFTVFIQERVIRRPLKQLSNAMERINQQDFSERLPPARKDEIGSLINTFKDMRRNLQMHDSQLYRMRDKALASSKAKSEFIAKMNHELRTPLNGILGGAQLIECDLDAGKRIDRQHLDCILNASNQLLDIVDKVITLAKNSEGKLQLDNNEFDFRSLAEHTVDLFAPMASKQNNKIKLKYLLEKEKIIGDRHKLQVILNNLVSNACKFTDNGDILVTIFFEDSEENKQIVIEVSDSGLGIKPEDQDEIFKPFIQVDNSYTREYDGTGLGLAMCRELTELMKGDLSVTSDFGKGSTFRLSFSQ